MGAGDIISPGNQILALTAKKAIIDLINLVSLGFITTKILPFAIVALFGIAFFAVSARIWLPGDMMSPAPVN